MTTSSCSYHVALVALYLLVVIQVAFAGPVRKDANEANEKDQEMHVFLPAPDTFNFSLCDPYALRVNTSEFNNSVEIATAMLAGYAKTLNPIVWLRHRVIGDTGPLVVYMQTSIENVFAVDQKAQEFKMIYEMQLVWRDCRLAFMPFTLDDEDAVLDLPLDPKLIWLPSIIVERRRASDDDISFADSVQAGTADAAVSFFGLVIVHLRLQHKIRCKFNFHRFPLDTQRGCGPQYRMFTDTVDLTIFDELVDPAVIPPASSPPEFTLLNFRTVVGTVNRSFAVGGINFAFNETLSSFSVLFDLDRNSYYWLVFTIIPTVLLWTISYAGFYIDPQSAPARATLGSVTVLSLVTLNNAILSSLPPIDYSSTLSIYILTTLGLACLHLVEYGLVNYGMRQGKKLREAQYKRDADVAIIRSEEFMDTSGLGAATSTVTSATASNRNQDTSRGQVRSFLETTQSNVVEPVSKSMFWRKAEVMDVFSDLDHYARWVMPLVFALASGLIWGIGGE